MFPTVWCKKKRTSSPFFPLLHMVEEREARRCLGRDCHLNTYPLPGGCAMLECRDLANPEDALENSQIDWRSKFGQNPVCNDAET